MSRATFGTPEAGLHDAGVSAPLTERLVRFTGVGLLAFGPLLALLVRSDAGRWTPMAMLDIALAAQGLLILLLLRTGRTRAAAMTAIWGTWMLLVAAAAISGGVAGPGLLNFPVIVVFAGWVLGTRPTILLAVLSALACIALIWATEYGWLPEPLRGNPVSVSVYVVGVLLFTALATLWSRRSYARSTEQIRETAEALAARDHELRKLYLAVEQSPDGIVIVDREHRIEYVNAAFADRRGQPRAEFAGQTLALELRTAGHTRAAGPEAIWAEVDGGHPWRGEVLSRRRDESPLEEAAVFAPIRQDDGTITHHVGVLEDLTEHRRAQARIERLSNYDPLTGLPNRAHLIRSVSEALVDALDARKGGALLLLDLDRFKTVNNARGQAAGDRVLVEISRRLRAALRDAELVARVTADQFGVVVQGLATDPVRAGLELTRITETLLARMREPVALADGERVTLSGSVGIARFPLNSGDTAEEALRRAETALTRAKAEGGDRSAFFEPEMEESAQQRFQVERELRAAVPAGELKLFLQPQVDVEGRWVAAEALVRWQHPEAGLVPPGIFIPVAEESDLIVLVDRWVLSEACSLLAREGWVARGQPLRLSVNVSARHFLEPDFVGWLEALLARTGADPSLLTLEVTETLFIDDVDGVVARMDALCASGVHFSIDDFGTGYSSLAYLKRLPIEEIKIDKSFVQEAPTDPGDAVLVESILAVGLHMHKRLVAEGVETLDQAEFLAARAPEVLFQGYLFGRPEPAAQWLRKWRVDGHRFAALRAATSVPATLSEQAGSAHD